MLGNYLQRAIDEIRVARSELPMLAEAGVRDFGTVQQALEALLDALQDVDRRLSSLEAKVGVEEPCRDRSASEVEGVVGARVKITDCASSSGATRRTMNGMDERPLSASEEDPVAFIRIIVSVLPKEVKMQRGIHAK